MSVQNIKDAREKYKEFKILLDSVVDKMDELSQEVLNISPEDIEKYISARDNKEFEGEEYDKLRENSEDWVDDSKHSIENMLDVYKEFLTKAEYLQDLLTENLEAFPNF